MKTIALKIKEYHLADNKMPSAFWISIVINLELLFLWIFLSNPRFDTIDDMILCNMVDGSMGIQDAHMIYINCLMGYLLKWLYGTVPVVPWYMVIQYSVLFISFMALTWVILKRTKSNCIKYIWFAFLLILTYEGYYLIQYTKTAAIAAVAGVVLLFFYLETSNNKVLITGYLLALTGTLYRMKESLAVIILLSGIGVYFLSNLIGDKKWMRKLVKGIGTFFVLFLLIFGCHIWDQNQYRAEEWPDYLKYNELRTQLWDFGFPSYEEHQQEYLELGVDSTMNDLLHQQIFSDTDRMTADVLDKIVSLKENKKINLELFANYVMEVLFQFKYILLFNVSVFLGLTWLLIYQHNINEKITIIYEIMLINVVYFYLYYHGRYFVNRVDMGLWLAFAMVIFWMLKNEFGEKVSKITTISIVILLIVILYMPCWEIVHSQISYGTSFDQKSQQKEYIQEINYDQEHLYLSMAANGMGPLIAYGAWEPLERIPDSSMNNLCHLGGWTARSGIDNAIWRQYGINNPFRDGINNDKVYFLDIDENIDVVMKYIQKWYAPNAKEEFVKNVGDWSVYRIVE